MDILAVFRLRSVKVACALLAAQATLVTFLYFLLVVPRPAYSPPSDDHGLKRRLPKIIIIGFAKCGTGTLREFLDAHPNIKVAHREIHYFDIEDNYRRGIEWYRDQMPLSREWEWTLEQSPAYLKRPLVPERMHQFNSKVYLLVAVKDPTERLISNYAHDRALHGYQKGFGAYIMSKGAANYSEANAILSVGIYVQHIARFLRYFPLKQIHFVDGKAFVQNPLKELIKVETFLGLKHRLKESDFVWSKTRGFYCRSMKGKPKCPQKGKGRKHPNVSMQLVKKCQDFYRPYNEQFFKLINKRFQWA